MSGWRSVLAGLLAILVTVGAWGGTLAGTARADSAPLDPANPATPSTVSADALPTVQIDGVAWSQIVVGNTVYVGGEFTKARPAGAPAGTAETTRNNLLAYDIRTGELITSFAPDINGAVKAVAASPDGSRIYVGGAFTRADGQARYRIAAYNTATGALDPAFRPAFDAQVKAIAVSSSTVYAGGIFKAVGSAARTRLAAVDRTTGALQAWAPVAASQVTALTLTPQGTKVIAGGSFAELVSADGAQRQVARGIGAVDAATGIPVPWEAGRIINNTGSSAAVLSLAIDDDTVYGSGYTYGPGNLEGVVAADAETGAIRWINDCRGDTYSVWASGTAAYIAGHPHVCSNIGGWPQTEPWSFYRGIAFSKAATGKVGTETGNFVGQPAPSLLNWFPTIDAGTYTGQNQGPWTVTGNDQYVVYGGEFPRVNGTAQQGLVRFAVPSIAPNQVGPSSNPELTPSVVSLGAGTVRVAWQATHDRDNENLTYRVYRDGDTTTPVYEVTRASTFWQRPMMAWTDTGLDGGTHRYRLTVTDPMGNRVSTGWVSADVVAGTSSSRAYAETVRADGVQNYWPLGESSGTTAYDHTSAADATIGSGVTLDVAGAVEGDQDSAQRFAGTGTGLVAMRNAVAGPQTFTIETWFSTTSNGGKIVGFGDRNSGNSNSYDRQVYMDRLGRLLFGVYPGQERTVTSANRYNDGKWHHVVASLGASGMRLYVDGQLVGSRADTTSAQNYTGYWRVGGDSSWGNTNQYFNGSIDEVAIYPSELPADRVLNHYTLASTGVGANIAPTAAFTSSTADLTASFDASGSTDPDGTIASVSWAFGDGTSGTGTTTNHTYAAAGTYPVSVTVTDDDGATGTRTGTVTVTDPPANVVPTAAFSEQVTGLAVSVDGAGSSDPDGSVASWAWDFGDGSVASGVQASRTYAAAGTYVVRLTVTDDDGGTGSVERSVTVTAVPDGAVVPVVTDAFERVVAAGLGRADLGGSWSVSGSASVSGGVGNLDVAAAGRSTAVWLNSVSAADVALQMDVSLQQAPTGGGTYVYSVARRTAGGHYRAVVRFLADGRVKLGISRVVSGAETTLRSDFLPGTYTPGEVLRVRLDVSGAETATLNAKAWKVGEAEPGTWQTTATDATESLRTAGGVGLTAYLSGSSTAVPARVTVDNVWAGPTGSSPDGAAEPPANVVPTAAFVEQVAGLAVSVDGAGSSDPDGSVASWAWDFGDGSTAPGVQASHTYAAAGTYVVRLTVTDDDGGTGSVERSVTVTAVPDGAVVPVVTDAFERAVAAGLGRADLGGWWSVSGSASVSGGVGNLDVAAAGRSTAVWLNSVSAADVALQMDVSLQQAPTGGGTYVYSVARRTAGGHYRAVVRFLADGRVKLGISRVVSGAETTLRSDFLPGTYTPGEVLRVRLDVSGAETATLNAKAWKVGEAEPGTWQTTATDATESLRTAGGVGLTAYLSGSSTAVPARVTVDNVWAGPAGSARPE